MVEQLPKKKQLDFLLSLIRYALDAAEPETNDAAVLIGFEAVRPILDKARKRALAGKIGGEAAPSPLPEFASNPQANRKQMEANGSKPQAEKEGEKEKEREKEKEKEGEGEKEGCSLPLSSKELSADVSYALERGGVAMDDKAKAECLRLCEEYGDKAVIEAADRARDNGAPRWAYIRAIVTSGGVQNRIPGTSTGARRVAAQCQGHDERPSPAMLAAIQEMLEDPTL